MEVTMPTPIKGDPSGICRTPPAEFFLLTQRIERNARAARDAAIARAVRLVFASPLRTLQAAGAALLRWQRQRQAAADLHAMSDYSLRDIGIPRSQIDERVRLAAKRYVRPHNSAGLI
jgi:uncharacterized protein YjiS (DUF1127 family)